MLETRMYGISYEEYRRIENLDYTTPVELPEDEVVRTRYKGRWIAIPLACVLAWAGLVSCQGELQTPEVIARNAAKNIAKGTPEAVAMIPVYENQTAVARSNLPPLPPDYQQPPMSQSGIPAERLPAGFEQTVQAATAAAGAPVPGLSPEPLELSTPEPTPIPLPRGTQIVPYGERFVLPLEDADGNSAADCTLEFSVVPVPDSPEGLAKVTRVIFTPDWSWTRDQEIGPEGELGAPLCADHQGADRVVGKIYRTPGEVTLSNGAIIVVPDGSYVFEPVIANG